MDSECDTCKHHCGENYSNFELFCIDHNFCSYDRDENKPLYSVDVAKQLIFDCAAELYHGNDGLTKEQVANMLMDIVKEMDKM